MNRRTLLYSGIATAMTAASRPVNASEVGASTSAPLTRPIDLRRTAHLCIDLQNGFVEKGAPVEVPAARDIIPTVNAISTAIRKSEAINIFVQFTLGSPDVQSWSNWFARMPESQRPQQERFLERGSHYHQLWPDLAVMPADLKVEKSRFSAFIPGASDLNELLKRRGLNTLIITGTLTNVCCESTARDAMQMNYRVIFIEDATAARTPAEHNAAIANMRSTFGEVLTAKHLIANLHAS
ncbi:cysteine hydrolase family protein [Edaphobacter acidisoli]|uniref:cysteine hydrolase family protein n=1 Tax=Edaphobacter acidisoli TaxID=2040573 RepID=UPI00166E3797|nr:cysteine hydrolase [Edaphobacter acidisoli]